MDSTEVRHLDVHGYRRAYRIAGGGPPLLLIHGIADSSETWKPVMSMLAEHHTVIAPDLLGHGDSDKPRADYGVAAYACGMRDLLGVLGVDEVTVVGHSLGGGIAMQFAYQFPERCERLVLVSSGGVGREVHPLLRLASGPLAAETGLALATSAPVQGLVRLAAPLLRRGLRMGPDFDHVLARYQGLTSMTARQAFLRTLRAGVDMRGQVITMLDRCYLTAGMPTLIIWGANDTVIPATHATVAHHAMPGSRLCVFPRTGHFPHHDQPERFVDTVVEFIKSTHPQKYDQEKWRDFLRTGHTFPPETSSGT
ncbi:alpha/beta fold hydrolase [Herbidospora cretacea]|uniref:alpha/beta fold hydrolase n=1 Tax=Herbidospora cretacea TaxID=28444 RepID=UPI0007732835|nr:alpha/beta hydrolase [Herbidospora cretacea]